MREGKKIILLNSDYYSARVNEAKIAERLRLLVCEGLQTRIARKLMQKIRSGSDDISELFKEEFTVLDAAGTLRREITQDEVKKMMMRSLFIIVRETHNEKYVRIRDIA